MESTVLQRIWGTEGEVSESSCHGGLGTIDFTRTRSTCRHERSPLSQNSDLSITGSNTTHCRIVLFHTAVKLSMLF